MVEKLQPTMPAVTSLRQYSPAEAGVAKLTKARAHSAVAGAANFKNVFMLLSLYSLLLRAVFQPLPIDMGALQMSRYARMAVPLANPLLAGVHPRSYLYLFGSNDSRATRASVGAGVEGISSDKPGIDRISLHDRGLKYNHHIKGLIMPKPDGDLFSNIAEKRPVHPGGASP